jgi:hypothetical protein
LIQPIIGSGNSNAPFFTSSALKPPSAPKLMSSKNAPHIAGLMLAPGLSASTVIVTGWACAVLAVVIASTMPISRIAQSTRRGRVFEFIGVPRVTAMDG